MHRSTLNAFLLCAVLAAGACNREGDKQKMVGGSEAQTESARSAMTPTTVAGCLKAGDAENIYVLATAPTEGAPEPATYQLVGDRTANLREHIGNRIEVKGTVEAQQEIATRSTAKAPEDQPTGTSGTPRVQTRAEIEIKRLSVESVKPLGEKCAD